MTLFLTIIAVSFLLTIATDVMKFLGVSALFTRRFSKTSQCLQDELQKAEAEYKRDFPDSSHWSYENAYGRKSMEEMIQQIKVKINKERMVNNMKRYSADIVTRYGIKAVLYLYLVTISIRNRYNPVLVLNDDINLQPLSGLLSFPTGVANAVSVPIWILSCNVTFSLFAGIIKGRISGQK